MKSENNINNNDLNSSPIVVALDYADKSSALAFADKIDPRDCRLKIGKEMFTHFGPQMVKDLQSRGFDVFLDLKFHDIPNTTARGGRRCRPRRVDGECARQRWRAHDDGGERGAGALW